MKRTPFAILGVALAAFSLTGGTQTATDKPAAPPMFETKKVEGTDNVYIFRAGGAQSMFVVTSAGVIATDPISYARREAGEMYVQEIRKVTNQPIRYLTFLQETSAEVRKAAQEGKCWDTAEKEVTMSKYSSWPGYAVGLPMVVRRYCGLWGRGT